ncbi:MAG: HEAT repeat domain-containing protein [Acidimicrobiales bacterium]
MTFNFGAFVIGWALVGVTLFLYLGTGVYLDVSKKLRTKRRLAVLDDFGVLLFDSNEDAARVHHRVTAAKKSVLLDVIQRLALDVKGDAEDRLQQLVRTCGLERLIRRRSRARRWRKRVQAAQLHYLVTHPDFDRSPLLTDKHPLVRARSVETLTGEQAEEHVELVASLLKDPAMSVRLAAKNALLRAGSAAIEPLLGLLAEGGDHVGEAMDVAADLPDARLVEALKSYATSENETHRQMAARSLGTGTGVSAADILHVLLNDEAADVRVAAILALKRLESYESAVAIGRGLSDSSFQVRRQAGHALDELGPAGQLVLRQALQATDPFARDMARQVLDGSMSPSAHLVSSALRQQEALAS